jgi:predicted secreted Zn-dependent protease
VLIGQVGRALAAPAARAILAGTILVAGCASPAPPSPAAPSAPGTTGSAAPTAPGTSAAPPSAPPATATPAASATPAAELLPIAGTWRVRKILSVRDRSPLVADARFDEETYVVRPGCETEPCDTVEVTSTPLGLTSPARVVALTRDGAMYASPAQPAESSVCVTSDGDRVAGGGMASTRLTLWIATDRPAGSAVVSTVLRGSIELDVAPTSIGGSAGCVAQSATFELQGRREAVAIRDPNGGAGPDLQPPAGAALVRLPKLDPKVPGATVRYFAISGDTSTELGASVARGGVKACGEIDYEWFRGDARPSACALTQLSDARRAVRYSYSASGSCRIDSSNIKATYTIHMPRWTAPPRVPKRLLDWWRRTIDFIAGHEAGHVRIGRDYMRKLNARLDGIDCDRADAVIRTWARQHAAAQEDYDRSEYSRPWPEPPAGY